MKILITGANGFIGSHLVNRVEPNNTVIRHGRTTNTLLRSSNILQVDINGRSDWRAGLQGVDVIVHLAAIAHNNSNDRATIDEVNIKGTINLAQQAVESGVKRFIFISSIGVLGNSTNSPFDESFIPFPHSIYAASKLRAEEGLLKICKDTKLEVVIIRPVLVYGKGAPGNFSKLIALIKKMPVLPFGLTVNKRSFISVNNLVDFISVCIKHPKAKNEVFCISDGHDASIREFTAAISRGLSKNVNQLPIPVFVLRVLGKLLGRADQMEQLVGDLQVDISKAKLLLGWSPPETMLQAMSKLK